MKAGALHPSARPLCCLHPSRFGSGRRIATLGAHRTAIVLLFGLLASTLHAEANWPSFRNDGSGTIAVMQAPIRWAPGQNISWQADIPGYGQSAPVVWQETVFLTSSDGPWQERGFVHAFELKTGKKRWSTEVPSTARIENYFRNSRAAPTSVVDGDIVVSFFPGGDVVAMSHQGKTIWSVPVFARFGRPKNDRATASSLTQTQDLVFALVDHHGPSYLVALRKKDGSVAWKADRGDRAPSWSSPAITTQEGREIVLVSSSGTVDAYLTQSGELLWSIEGMQGNRIPSASVSGNSIFVGSTDMAHGGTDAKAVTASNCRIDLKQQNGRPNYELRWRAQRAKSHYSTPLAFAGYVYYVTKSGVLYCLDAETGEELFRHRLGKPCWASPIGAQTANGEALIYFVMKDGETVVLRPGRTFDEVARNQLWDEEQMQAAAAAASSQRAANHVPPAEAPPKKGPEALMGNMPEKHLHRIFSYTDPTVYATALVEQCLLVRTGRHLFCVSD